MSVTVIVPSFNHEKYIKKCIISIVNQTFQDFKLIVIDDGSSDNSVAILEELSKTYNFQLIIQENLGLANTFNMAIRNYVDTEFVTFCASDDFWEKDKLLLQYNYMLENPHCLMCYGKMNVINEFGKIVDTSKKDKKLRGGDIFDDLILLKIHLPVSYFFRTIAFSKVGLYDVKIFAEDFDMNLRIANISNIGFVNEYIANYRINNIQQKLRYFDRVVDSHLITLEKFKNHKLYKRAKKRILLNRAYAYSIFKDTKLKSIKILFQNFEYIFTMVFIKTTCNLFIHWKKTKLN
jgi:glycosyltransferase involved in cell wall biosynthesis